MKQTITNNNVIIYTSDDEFDEKLTITTMLIKDEMCLAYVWDEDRQENACVFEFTTCGQRYDYYILSESSSYDEEYLENIAETLCVKIIKGEV